MMTTSIGYSLLRWYFYLLLIHLRGNQSLPEAHLVEIIAGAFAPGGLAKKQSEEMLK